MERYRDGFIAYSLGNFTFSDIDWNMVTVSGTSVRKREKLRKSQRKSVMVDCLLKGNSIENVDIVFCRIAPNGQVVEDHGRQRRREIDRLSARFLSADYPSEFERIIHRHSFLRKVREELSPERLLRIYRLRPRHLLNLYSLLASMVGQEKR
jgi:hypothetical protein